MVTGKTLKMATVRAQAADAKKSEAAERLLGGCGLTSGSRRLSVDR
ncbi:MAG: hypothetical protein ACLUZQ_06725 [Butyricicoccus sp.]